MQPENWSSRDSGLFAEGVTASGIEEAVKNAIDMCYGTDERHGLIAVAVADLLVYNKPIPWSLSKQFGRTNQLTAREWAEKIIEEHKNQ